MNTSSTLQPDPSVIGGISKAPFAVLPRLPQLFEDRAKRFEGLAETSRLASYLHFLADLSRLQATLSNSLPPVPPLDAEQVEGARAAAMPPIDRLMLAGQAACRETLEAFLTSARTVDMPQQAREALEAVIGTDIDTRGWMLENVLSDTIPPEGVAHHLFVAAAVQVHAARLAATLEAGRLVPVGPGVCPACGGRPVGSLVVGVHGAEGARYAVCSCCATRWNEVRVKCLACGSTKGIGYRAVEAEEATIKAEVCDSCQSWTKILYQNRNPSLDIVADDVASLGLDLLMHETGYRRAGFDPFLIGY